MANVIIHNDNFTDDNGELHYFNTGRDNISGLAFPTHYIRNKDNYFYTKILNIKLSMDTALIYPIHECFLLTTYEDNNKLGVSNIITLDAIVKEGTIKEEDINITCTPLNFTTIDLGGKIHSVKAALRTETNANGHLNMTLGIWLYSKDIVDIIVKDLSSLGFNQIPNNILQQFLQCDYESYYLNNEDIMYDVNMFNFEDSIGIKIAEGININKLVIDHIQTDISMPTAEISHDHKFLSVIYDDLYKITEADVDETIRPAYFQYAQVDNEFAKIVDDYVQVNEDGEYLIALKVNMDIHSGNAVDMTMSFFLNEDRIDETTSSVYLDPNNKVHPLGFLAGQVQLQLRTSDKLYLKAKWSKNKRVNIENHCSLQITKL